MANVGEYTSPMDPSWLLVKAARKSVGWFLTILWKIKNNGVLPPKKREMHKLTYLPLKISMEPKNHPIERKIIFQTSIIVFHVNVRGCSLFWALFFVVKHVLLRLFQVYFSDLFNSNGRFWLWLLSSFDRFLGKSLVVPAVPSPL